MNIKETIMSAGSKALFKVKKASPELLIFGGIITGGYATYKLCKQTLKVTEIVDETKETLEKIHTQEDKLNNGEEPKYEENGELVPYTEEVAKRDKFIAYLQCGTKIAKNYAPAVGLYILSIAMILGGFKIIKGRYVATMGVLTATQNSFKEYRKKIADKYGKNIDLETLLGVEHTTETEEEVDKKGNIKVKETEKHTATKSRDDDSDFTRLFDELNAKTWKNDPVANFTFLKSVEKWCTNRLRTRGHLFLNEVYDALGMEHTKTGALCGWILDGNGDDFVDFGLDGIPREWDWYEEPNMWLNFNCEGAIYDKI
jgi:hypothetical protein